MRARHLPHARSIPGGAAAGSQKTEHKHLVQYVCEQVLVGGCLPWVAWAMAQQQSHGLRDARLLPQAQMVTVSVGVVATLNERIFPATVWTQDYFPTQKDPD